jgi:hypothetical protein
MTYLHIGRTRGRDDVYRSENARPRTFIVPNAFDLAAPDRTFAAECGIRDLFEAALAPGRPSSVAVSGVEIRRGSSSDFVIVSRSSGAVRAILHVMVDPHLADADFLARLRPPGATDAPVLLLSETECVLATVAGPSIIFSTVVAGGNDLPGRVVDYLREHFGEDRKVRVPRLTLK